VSYQFAWDPAKAAGHLRKHGVPFEEAVSVFGDPLALNMPDPLHFVSEQRYLLLRMSVEQRLVVVAYGERGERTRIISARKATRRERHD
jgi:hypothetical protein